ncbi:hypothetical protein Tco_0771882 [Tanacetum coccineum]|uniref:Uncharacterized protein n=1 Tax=Tanacetum coccineum TaxID=301880 RepID=A0ABQ4ZIA2_9ASTR
MNSFSPSKTLPLVDDDLDEDEAIKVTEKKNLENDIVDETLEIDEIVNTKESRNHPLENVIGNLNQRTLREIKKLDSRMLRRINQFVANNVWSSSQPQEYNPRVLSGYLEIVRRERFVVSRNKARTDYQETFSHVADIRAIRILIAIAAYYDYEI